MLQYSYFIFTFYDYIKYKIKHKIYDFTVDKIYNYKICIYCYILYFCTTAEYIHNTYYFNQELGLFNKTNKIILLWIHNDTIICAYSKTYFVGYISIFLKIIYTYIIKTYCISAYFSILQISTRYCCFETLLTQQENIITVQFYLFILFFGIIHLLYNKIKPYRG